MAPLLGPFRLVRPLARGAAGVVWLGRHVLQEVEVAIKLMPRADPDAFLREASAIAALDHPAIVWIHDLGRATAPLGPDLPEGTPWIATELAAATLAERPPTSWDGLRAVLGALLAALAHAHARGLVHRDVKPANVLVGTDRPGPKLADWGLGASPGTPGGGGTPAFLAPEAWRGEPRGPASDLYALGVLAFGLVTGGPPFPDADASALRAAHERRRAPPVRPRFPLPPGAEDWIARLLAKSVAERPASAAEAAAGLRALGRAAPGASVAPAPEQSDATLPDLGIVAPVTTPEDSVALPERSPIEWVDWRRAVGPEAPVLIGTSPGLIVLRRPATVGREIERDRLWDALRRVVVDRRSARVGLGGPPGVGVRHLARWVGETASELGLAELVHDDAAARDPSRPYVRIATAPPVGDDPALVLVVGAASPDLSLGPLEPDVLGALVRRVAPLEPGLLADLVAGAEGLPGPALAAVRRWAREERLAPGPDGLALRGPGPGGTGSEDPWADVAAAHARILAGDPLAAEHGLRRIERQGPTGRLAARVLAERAQLASIRGRPALQRTLAEAALAATEGEDWPEERVAAGLMLARSILDADPVRCASLAEEAAALADSRRVPGAVLAWNLAANAALRLGDLDRAEQLLGRALAVAPPREAFPSHLAMARAAQQRGDGDAARVRIAAARAAALTGGSALQLAHADTALGVLELELGDPAEALTPLRAALAVFDRLDHGAGIATELLLGEACWRSGAPEAARGHAGRALVAASGVPGRATQRAAAALVLLGVAAETGEELDRALAGLGAPVTDTRDPLFRRLPPEILRRAQPRLRGAVDAALGRWVLAPGAR